MGKRLAGLILALMAAAPGFAAARTGFWWNSSPARAARPAAGGQVHGRVGRRGDVVALTLPVDIWDYLGWRDTFAQRLFSERQSAYAERLPARSVYTPQMVIAGNAEIVGSRRGDAWP